MAAILGSAWILFVRELSSYYFVYLAAFGFPAVRRSIVALGVAILSVAMAALGIAYGGEHVHSLFVWSSVALGIFCAWVTALFALLRGDEESQARRLFSPGRSRGGTGARRHQELPCP